MGKKRFISFYFFVGTISIGLPWKIGDKNRIGKIFVITISNGKVLFYETTHEKHNHENFETQQVM